MAEKMTRTVTRRELLKIAAQLGVSIAALEVARRFVGAAPQASASDGSSRYHWAMVIDLSSCTGCNYCSYACKATNDTGPDIYWNAVFEDKRTYSKPVFLPRPCMHCEHAPCVDVCPVGATFHRPDGLVAMDYDKCIGCRYCQVACPYGARYFNWTENTAINAMTPTWGAPEIPRRPRGVVEKCTFCAHRIDAGLAQGRRPGIDEEATPACVNVCPVGARVFGDLNDPNSRVSELLRERESVTLRESVGSHPRVFYLLPDGGADL